MSHPTTSHTEVTKAHPFGWFWMLKRKDWVISRIDIVNVASKLGFCLYKDKLHRILGVFVYEVTIRNFHDCLLGYLLHCDENMSEQANALEAFMQRSGEYTITRLPILDNSSLLNDDADNCFKFFNNCFIHITADEIAQHTYDQLPPDKYVLHSKVQQRDFAMAETGKYLDFLCRATSFNEHTDNIQSIIGYLAHEYKDETTGYIIVLTEQCPDPKDGGGSGKNLFCTLLSYTTTYFSKSAKQVSFDSKLLQSWKGQRVMGISDVPEKFDWEFFKEPSTGATTVKKLYKDEDDILIEDSPKFIMQTNYSYDGTDGGLIRRIKPMEFTSFFTDIGGVDVYYGCHFPKGWTTQDWNNFDTVIINSVKKWLKLNRKIETIQLTETGWEKQFELTHGKNMADFIRDHFNEWVTQSTVKSEDIRAQIKTFYTENDINIKYHYSAQRLAKGIKEWSRKHGYNCYANRQIKELGVNFKAYVFEKV